MAQAWNFGWGDAMEKVYGLSVKNTLVFKDDKKTDYYTDDKQHKDYIAGLYRLLNDSKFIKIFHKDARKTLEKIQEKVAKQINQDLSKLSNADLLKIYQQVILPNQIQFYVRMWTVFNIGEPLADLIKAKLNKKFKEDKATAYLLSLSSPLEPNDVLNERIDLLRLKAKKLSGSKLEIATRKHWLKYRHIPMFDFDHDPYIKEHFVWELEKIKDHNIELKKLEESFINRKKEFKKVLKELRPDKKFRSLLEFLKENVFLRDYRDMIRQKLNLSLRDFYMEIGKRLDLTISQIALLTNDEIIEYLNSSKFFPKNAINERGEAFLLIQKGNEVQIYSGDLALEKVKNELDEDKLNFTDIIKGVTGSCGKVKGIVKIIYTNKDLDKVKDGDILVATMTRQDFIVAIRRAKALVTDEGSVTAHAAIIARELRIPCIVATKIGTQILKDGDFVEVDANKGLVKILSQKLTD